MSRPSIFQPAGSWLYIILSVFLIGWIGSWSRQVKRGNEYYESGQYDAALEAYQSATDERPNAPISRYNLGAALYQNKQFDEASSAFRRSLDATAPNLRAQAYYNLGNTQVRLHDFEGAIRSYKSALRLSPGDENAKHNLEFALEKLAAQQSQQQNKSEAGNPQDQNPEDQQRSSRQKQEQNEQQEPQTEEKAEQHASENQPQESPSTPAQESDELSKENAIRLLDALKGNEKEIQKKVLRKRFARSHRTEKDW